VFGDCDREQAGTCLPPRHSNFKRIWQEKIIRRTVRGLKSEIRNRPGEERTNHRTKRMARGDDGLARHINGLRESTDARQTPSVKNFKKQGKRTECSGKAGHKTRDELLAGRPEKKKGPRGGLEKKARPRKGAGKAGYRVREGKNLTDRETSAAEHPRTYRISVQPHIEVRKPSAAGTFDQDGRKKLRRTARRRTEG